MVASPEKRRRLAGRRSTVRLTFPAIATSERPHAAPPEKRCTNHALLVHVRPARSIFSNALNFCRSAIAALVRSPCRYCPFRSPGGAPLPLAPPCNRQRPFFVAGDRQGLPLLVRALPPATAPIGKYPVGK